MYFVVAVVALALVGVGLALLARRARRGGTAGSAIAGAMAAYDEAMHTTAYDEFVETQQQADRTIPATSRDPDNRR
jgi:hypothetical protein